MSQITNYKYMTYIKINFSEAPDWETIEDFVDTLGTYHFSVSRIGSEDFRYILTGSTLEISIFTPLPGVSYSDLIEKTADEFEGLLEVTSFIACLMDEDLQKITYEVLREDMSGVQESTQPVDTFKERFSEFSDLPERFEYLYGIF